MIERTEYQPTTNTIQKLASERDRHAFNKLLDLAEQLFKNCEIIRSQIRRLLMAGLFGIVLGLISAGVLITYLEQFSDIRLYLETIPNKLLVGILFITLGISLTFLVLYLSMTVVGRLLKQLRRESRALKEVMALIHEVYEGLQANLSPLERAEVRIRLSRLDN